MRTKAKTPSSPSRATAIVLAYALAACSGGAGSASNDASAKKEPDSGSSDVENADKPASLSGSYLTADHMSCAIPTVKKGDKYIQACCVLRDKQNTKVKVKNLANDTFKVAPPAAGSAAAPKIQAVNLTAYDKQLCHVVYRSEIPGGSPASGLALAGAAPLTGKQVIKGFLYSFPLFRRSQPAIKATSLSAAKPAVNAATSLGGGPKKALGLNLFGDSNAAAIHQTFLTVNAELVAAKDAFADQVDRQPNAVDFTSVQQDGTLVKIGDPSPITFTPTAPAADEKSGAFGGTSYEKNLPASTEVAPTPAAETIYQPYDENADEPLLKGLESSDVPPESQLNSVIDPTGWEDETPAEQPASTQPQGQTTSQVDDYQSPFSGGGGDFGDFE